MSKTIGLLLLISTIALATSRPATAQDKPAFTGIKACNQALKLLDEGKPAEAIKVLDAAKGTMDPEDEWLWWGNKGHAHRDLRQDKEALEHFGKACQLKPDCWFRFPWCRLLHEYGRWGEALKELEGEIDPDYADRAAALKQVIEGPFKSRWPLTHTKLQTRSKAGNYLVVSDVGVTEAEMDKLEAEAAKLDLTKKPDQSKLEKLVKPHDHLVSLANLAELARKEFMRFTGVKEGDLPKGKTFKVFFFSREADFHSFATACGGDGDTENTLGFYSPNLRYMQLFSQEGSATKVCGLSADTIDTFFHEGWHQFFDMLTEQRPIWLDEGLAEFLGYASVKEQGRVIELGLLVRVRGETYTRYERIKEMMLNNQHTPLRNFFKFDTAQWNQGEVNHHYAQAWSIAYYALKGDNDAFRKDYSKLFLELVKGKRAQDLVPEIFPDKKLDELEKSWLAYWRKN